MESTACVHVRERHYFAEAMPKRNGQYIRIGCTRIPSTGKENGQRDDRCWHKAYAAHSMSIDIGQPFVSVDLDF